MKLQALHNRIRRMLVSEIGEAIHESDWYVGRYAMSGKWFVYFNGSAMAAVSADRLVEKFRTWLTVKSSEGIES
jgi:hypothetical protein